MDLFTSLFSDFFDSPAEVYTQSSTSQKRCPGCSRTWNDFRRTGRFGCSECYSTFRSPAASALRQIHSTTRHNGKVPSKADEGLKSRREYEDLKLQLRQVVAAEDYEKAAVLHKKIREMERKGI